MCGLVTRSGERSVWRAYHRGCMSRPISSLSPAASPLALALAEVPAAAPFDLHGHAPFFHFFTP